MNRRLPFNSAQHGWHFKNNVSTDIASLFRTYGLCGGMSLSALNYYRHGLPIPSLRWNDIPAFGKVNTATGEMVNVPTSNPGLAHPVFDFIFHSQLATFESKNIYKQIVAKWLDTNENHYNWSVNDEYPQIKNAIDNGCFVIIGLRDSGLGHQTLVYGYDDTNSTLYMYDCNHPDEEVMVTGNGQALQFSGPSSGYNQYKSYYLQLTLDPNIRSAFTTYDVLRDSQNNFSVRPSYLDPQAMNGRIEPGTYTIQSKLSGKVLDIDLGFANLGGQNNGALLQQWDSTSNNNQKFKIESVDNGYFKITAMHSNKALDVTRASTGDGAPLQQWDFWDGANQLFSIEVVAGNNHKIISKNSGKVLDVYGFSHDNGAKINQYSFHGGENQLWIFNRI